MPFSVTTFSIIYGNKIMGKKPGKLMGVSNSTMFTVNNSNTNYFYVFILRRIRAGTIKVRAISNNTGYDLYKMPGGTPYRTASVVNPKAVFVKSNRIRFAACGTSLNSTQLGTSSTESGAVTCNNTAGIADVKVIMNSSRNKTYAFSGSYATRGSSYFISKLSGILP